MLKVIKRRIHCGHDYMTCKGHSPHDSQDKDRWGKMGNLKSGQARQQLI